VHSETALQLDHVLLETPVSVPAFPRADASPATAAWCGRSRRPTSQILAADTDTDAAPHRTACPFLRQQVRG
jgi:hypothetical protein